MILLLPEKSHENLIKVASGNGSDLLINITYFYAKLQDSFFCSTFLQF